MEIGNGFDWVKDRFLDRDMSGEDIEPTGNGILGAVDGAAVPLATADASGGGAGQSNSAGTGVSDDASAPVGQYVLPGFGVAYLDPGFADKVGNFITGMQAAGIPLQITQAYRSPGQQAALRSNPTAITPAQNSLHSTGNAIDIDRSHMDPATLARTVEIAASSGLQWGGNFRKPDPVHFYSDPGGNRVDNIGRFSRGIEDYKNTIPDY